MGLTTRKFYTMLLGGMMSSLFISLVLVSDSVIAGSLIGSER